APRPGERRRLRKRAGHGGAGGGAGGRGFAPGGGSRAAGGGPRGGNFRAFSLRGLSSFGARGGGGGARNALPLCSGTGHAGLYHLSHDLSACSRSCGLRPVLWADSKIIQDQLPSPFRNFCRNESRSCAASGRTRASFWPFTTATYTR